MDLIRINLDTNEAIKTKNGFIIMRYGEPMEVEASTIEARIDTPTIGGMIDILESFRGTKGINSIDMSFKVNNNG